MKVKFETVVRSNMKYILPEEVVEAFECGIIPNSKIDFVKNIVDNAEIVKPVTFDEWKGVFSISIKRGLTTPQENIESVQKHESVIARNAQTEINDKISALMSFYGDKVVLLSSHDIINKLNEVLEYGYVHNISNIELHKKLSFLNDDGQLSQNNINLYESDEPQKQRQ